MASTPVTESLGAPERGLPVELAGGSARWRVVYDTASQRERRNMIRILKMVTGCADCGGTERPMHYDHVRPEEKSFEIGEAVNLGPRHGYTWPVVLAEMRKCEVRCNRCHGKHHTWLGDRPIRASA